MGYSPWVARILLHTDTPHTIPTVIQQESTPLLCLEGVPDLPVAPQDEAGLTKTFQTWPRGWFHIP